jgi:hypothetical protein
MGGWVVVGRDGRIELRQLNCIMQADVRMVAELHISISSHLW